MAYMHELAWWAGNHLAAKWKTRLIAPEHMCGSMIDIELPVKSLEEAEALKKHLFEAYHSFLIVYPLQGKVFTVCQHKSF